MAAGFHSYIHLPPPLFYRLGGCRYGQVSRFFYVNINNKRREKMFIIVVLLLGIIITVIHSILIYQECLVIRDLLGHILEKLERSN